MRPTVPSGQQELAGAAARTGEVRTARNAARDASGTPGDWARMGMVSCAALSSQLVAYLQTNGRISVVELASSTVQRVVDAVKGAVENGVKQELAAPVVFGSLPPAPRRIRLWGALGCLELVFGVLFGCLSCRVAAGVRAWPFCCMWIRLPLHAHGLCCAPLLFHAFFPLVHRPCFVRG